jgi:hypothetical protein
MSAPEKPADYVVVGAGPAGCVVGCQVLFFYYERQSHI